MNQTEWLNDFGQLTYQIWLNGQKLSSVDKYNVLSTKFKDNQMRFFIIFFIKLYQPWLGYLATT